MRRHGGGGRTAGTRGDSGYVGVGGAPTCGVYGLTPGIAGNQTYGVFGEARNAASFGVWSQGNAHVAGTLSQTAGSFKIDHPLDPERKWLSHSFVESPDMMNVYNGNVVLDGAGKAVVELPDYFDALNADFRYQLTPIGGSAPVYIASKVSGNKFGIAGGAPGLEVSWQVTGVRPGRLRQGAPDRGRDTQVEGGPGHAAVRPGEFVGEGDAGRAAACGSAGRRTQAPSMKTPTPRSWPAR